jgi:hypothetical protein
VSKIVEDSNIIKIDQYEFSSVDELVDFCREAIKAVSVLQDQVNTLVAEKAQAAENKWNSEAELDIAEMELMRLRNKSIQGPLSLEEAKIYDILVKNKNIATGNAKKKKVKEIKPEKLEQLRKIAAKGKS